MIAYIFFLSHGQSHPMFTEMLTGMLCQVDKELANAARSETSSVLRARGYDAMNTLYRDHKTDPDSMSHSVQFPLPYDFSE